MKTLLILLLLTVMCCVSYNSAAPAGLEPLKPRRCCDKVSQAAVSKGRIRHMELSHSMCKHKALLITTVCNVTVCIDANWKWAKKALAEFKKSTADKRVPSATFNLLPCNTTSS